MNKEMRHAEALLSDNKPLITFKPLLGITGTICVSEMLYTLVEFIMQRPQQATCTDSP